MGLSGPALPADGVNGDVLTRQADGVDWQPPGIGSESVSAIVTLTQAAYDALDPPDPATLYVIVG